MENLTNDQIIEHIKTMTALQLKELVSAIEETFGVTAAVAVQGPVATGASEASEAKQASAIYLKEVGAAKVQVIKLMKEKLGMDLMSAKKMTDAVAEKPQLLKDNVSPDELKELEEEFKKLGAIVEIK
ncbi:50S ribosomal protein L7/L12 [Spiroplasma platyhelix]|uniref:Large ribosomal subunit protein bL12 n=1 Tax=Spiroplasma platyhelix PALS-1 TaxID=1276218 RepID=A0A846TTH1_9MOLU|nr:50S ribosomal protein L7/L12 [Spiroplasma platyhelix]MBE4704436.1 50S ribosomal protein L7/L12 [Spiroplasma platyhelix PALS-1]NKE38805.1 50S ribosomal protein L7/L12 [Spiroplasma platyhelix PALS-1]UJB29018.1 50S ribosomal protein L7/L12 [Spiroplasma platyhelix PALS-1]